MVCEVFGDGWEVVWKRVGGGFGRWVVGDLEVGKILGRFWMVSGQILGRAQRKMGPTPRQPQTILKPPPEGRLGIPGGALGVPKP